MDYQMILLDIYLTCVAIFAIVIFLQFFFCTSKNVFVDPQGKCYEHRRSAEGTYFWRPCKKFIFKNIFRYLLEDDQITVPDLIPYKEWLKLNG